jgi:transcriptional regulator with XRE-family HTH domain
MGTYQRFAESFNKVVENSGYTLIEIAEGAIVTVDELESIQKGESRPSSQALISIAKLLKVSPLNFSSVSFDGLDEQLKSKKSA